MSPLQSLNACQHFLNFAISCAIMRSQPQILTSSKMPSNVFIIIANSLSVLPAWQENLYRFHANTRFVTIFIQFTFLALPTVYVLRLQSQSTSRPSRSLGDIQAVTTPFHKCWKLSPTLRSLVQHPGPLLSWVWWKERPHHILQWFKPVDGHSQGDKLHLWDGERWGSRCFLDRLGPCHMTHVRLLIRRTDDSQADWCISQPYCTMVEMTHRLTDSLTVLWLIADWYQFAYWWTQQSPYQAITRTISHTGSNLYI